MTLLPVNIARQVHLQRFTLKDPPFRQGKTVQEPTDTVGNSGDVAVVVTVLLIDVSQNCPLI
jgi:hypothetical protein